MTLALLIAANVFGYIWVWQIFKIHRDKHSVRKADATKLLRELEPYPLVGVSNSGGKPRHPVRKRAFWRALKRGELWAVVPHEHMKSGGLCLTVGQNRFARVISDNHCPANTAYFMWPMEE